MKNLELQLLIENALTLIFANKQTLFHNFICEKPNREEEDQIDYMLQSPSTKFYEIDDILQKQKLYVECLFIAII